MTNLTIQAVKIARSLTLIALASSASTAFAGSTWTGTNFGTACTSTTVTNDTATSLVANYGASATCGSSSPAVSGYSTGTKNTSGQSTVLTTFSNAQVYDWDSGGLGVVAKNENAGSTGPHASDNIAGVDVMLLNFSAGGPVTLSSLTIGWNGSDNPTSSYKDSDLSILAWTGSAAPGLLGATLGTSTTDSAGLLKNGWTLVGNYADVGLSNGKYDPITKKNAEGSQSISTGIYSSYWLISAYSTAFGGSLSTGDDAFKILALTGSGCTGSNVVSGTACVPSSNNETPEPGSLALMGIAMAGFVATRRRKQKAA